MSLLIKALQKAEPNKVSAGGGGIAQPGGASRGTPPEAEATYLPGFPQADLALDYHLRSQELLPAHGVFNKSRFNVRISHLRHL